MEFSLANLISLVSVLTVGFIVIYRVRRVEKSWARPNAMTNASELRSARELDEADVSNHATCDF